MKEDLFRENSRNMNQSLICMGSGYKPPDLHKWGPGVRDIYALHYIASGRGILETRQGVFPLNAGESFILYPHTEVYYYPDPSDPWEYVWIEYKGEEARRLTDMTGFATDKPVVPASPVNLMPYFPLSWNANTKPYEKLRTEAMLRMLLSYYMEFFPADPLVRTTDYVELAKGMIESNYWKPTLTVSDIVDAVRLDRSYLFRLFKDATGMSVSGYLTAFRVQRACELLLSPGLTIKSVAYSVGYEDQLYFSKVFKKATSYTPSEYMTLHAASAANETARISRMPYSS